MKIVKTVADDVAELKVRITKREAQLKKILQFVESITQEYGRTTEHEDRGDRVKTTRELKDLNGLFDIVWCSCRECHITISYGFAKGCRATVFSASYACIDDAERYRVEIFSNADDWQKALTFFMENKDKIFEELRRKQTEAERAAEESIRQQKEVILLREKAKRLGLLGSL